MATHPASRSAAVGSLAWIANERSTFQQLEDQEAEDFAYSARNEMEWLNEHMADIFERSTLNLVDIMKTPGKMRGKTPRTAWKRPIGGSREPLVDIFATNQPLVGNPFNNAIAEIVQKKDSSPALPLREDSPIRSPQKQSNHTRDDEIDNTQTDEPEPSSDPPADNSLRIRNNVSSDSGYFTVSQPNSQVDINHSVQPRSSGTEQVFVDANNFADQRISEGTTARQSYGTAQEESPELVVSSPPTATLPQSSAPPMAENGPENSRPQSPTKLPPSVRKIVTGNSEPRRSGRIADRSSTDIVPSREVTPARLVDKTNISKPSPAPAQLASVVPECKSEEPVVPICTKEPVHHDESRSSSEPPTPEVPLVRKSSMNFASLPAREPLTSKKISMGAKAIRDSHLEQVRQGSSQMSDWMKKGGHGKSLSGGSKPIPPKETDDDYGESQSNIGAKRKSTGGSSRYQKSARRESNDVLIQETKETVRVPTKGGDDDEDDGRRRDTKTSTLRDRIQQLQLGRLSGPGRTARSIPAALVQTEPEYPDLSELNKDTKPASAKTPLEPTDKRTEPTAVANRPVQGDDPWPQSQSYSRPPLSRSYTEDVPKRVDNAFTRAMSPRAKCPSPLKPKSQPQHQHNPQNLPPQPTSPLRSPAKESFLSPPSSPLKTVTYASVNDVPQFTANATTPKKTPTTSKDTISAVREHTATMMKKAKEMFIKSAGVSAAAKAEILTSPSKGWKNREHEQEVRRNDETDRAQHTQEDGKNTLYPDLGSVLGSSKDIASTIDRPASPVIDSVRQTGRQTRSSRSRDEQASTEPIITEPPPPKRRTRSSKSADETQPAEPVTKNSVKSKKTQDQEARAAETRRRQQEEILMKEKELLKQKQLRQQEVIRREQEQRQANEAVVESEESLAERDGEPSRVGSVEPERQSRLQKGYRFQTQTEKTRQTKDQPKIKPGPVSIKIGTASQRELQDQRRKNTAQNSSSVSSLKSAFEPPRPDSQNTLQSQSSQGSIRSISSVNAQSKQLKSLTAAANQLKKEQEERERKATQKRDIEKRRIEKQKLQEEEQKRLRAQRERTAPGPSSGIGKSLSRVPQMSNLRQTSQEPEARKQDYQSKIGYKNGTIKRVIQPEEEQSQSIRHVPAGPSNAAYQQEGNKKRRTNDFEEPSRGRAPDMAPPIRSSVVALSKKDLVPKMPLHGYKPSALAPSQSVKSTTTVAAIKQSLQIPHVEGVKFSKEKIKFAGEATPAAPSANPYKTPGAKSTGKSMLKYKTPAGMKESPVYQNGELIELPEIPTDSEDEDDDYSPNFNIPHWAESPELRQLLRQQQTVDPEEIFGPMTKPDIDAIFRGGQGEKRFRARGSSANWSGSDRLTQAEVLADQEARKKLVEQGKWTYNISGL